MIPQQIDSPTGPALLRTETATEIFRKEPFTYTKHFYECQKTHKQYHTAEVENLNITQIYNQYRAEHRILFPEQIRHLRQQYDLSASKMSRLMDFGANQYRQYEDGEIPSTSNAAHLRLARDPRIFCQLIQDKQDELKPNEYERLIKRTEELKREQKATTGFIISKLLQRNLWNQDEIPSALTGFAVPRFDKFAQMVLYFYNHLDHVFTVRLMKLLFYADFLHFSRTGCSISGNKYKAITYGPVPQEYQMQLGMLIDEGYLSQDLDHTKRRSDTNEPVVVYEPLKKREKELLTDAEWETLDAVATYLGRLKTNDLIDLSHQEEAWKKNEADRNLIDYQKYAFHLCAATKIPHH
ncbi:type II toxin-antitoxin system antitoxin SocA domain-containing protein [Hymenobacter coccineus]|uniref:Antitoxin SocA-like Panacea domain-containing protein n=1 Tax=Hymenobacter coccineus TaxID=1908235 RepID=A0A1G1SSP6_9BACT|nr:type II toxin-antitoxin system antitoxin SocA domain-containing protein [Hymenobacter coccineus]OGX81649.1 hypothetical protein BEN49_15100 [Hymenobacter coccineus]